MSNAVQKNTKAAIPDGEGLNIETETGLDVPPLSGEWEWSSANHYHFNHKVNVHFGRKSGEPGGWLGEIDNYLNSEGGEMWTVHIRGIWDDGTEAGGVEPEADSAREFESLAEAIAAVPEIISTHYGDTRYTEGDDA